MDNTTPATTRCHKCSTPEIARNATIATANILVRITAIRIRRCGTRSAITPPSRTKPSNPKLAIAATRESSFGPPPSSMICQTSATIQMPVPKSDRINANARKRYCRMKNGRNARGKRDSLASNISPDTGSVLSCWVDVSTRGRESEVWSQKQVAVLQAARQHAIQGIPVPNFFPLPSSL